MAELLLELKFMKNKSPGTDNFTVKDLRAVQPELFLLLYNYQLDIKMQLNCWKTNKTILIPKKKIDLDNASNWRPITISSVFVRLLHRKDVEKKCRHCMRVNESLQHTIQHCHFTHFPRMQRHDAICRLLQDEATKKNHTVIWEPIFITPNGRLKPDLFIISTNTICVVDITMALEIL